MARVKGRPISKRKYTVTQNGGSYVLSLPALCELQAGELVTYEILPDGCILVIPERVDKK